MPARAASPIRTAAEAAEYLGGLIDHERRRAIPYERLGLEPIRALLERLDHPERGLSVIHVAGSKGKGSTALMAEALLRGAGERVGTFTSPHLERWSERFRIDGAEVSGARLADAVEWLRPHVDALRAGDPGRAPTFFDATTAAALLLFREAGVDRAVIEVGLGGRLDSTNVVAPAVACVTSIELEHTAQLGNSLAQIAREKAGILKPRVPAVIGALAPDARAAVVEVARAVGAPLAELGRDFSVEVLEQGLDGLRLRLVEGPRVVEARLPVPGAHQAANAALALACVRRARGADRGLDPAAGLASVSLPGRVEVLRRAPWVIVDAAHTAASARALAAVLRGLARRRTRLVLSVSGGKDAGAILRELLPEASEVTLTRAEATRSLEPREIAAAVRSLAPGLPVRVVPNPHLALRAADRDLAADELLVAAGSVYLAGIARRVLRAPTPAARVAVTRSAPRTPLGEP